MAQPNVLFITLHDTGRHFGCYGRPVATPAIDQFAAQGVRFDNYFCTAPQCSPSRVSMTTGRYPHRAGVLGLCKPNGPYLLDPEVPTLAKSFAAAGYSTHLWGFQHEHTDSAVLGYQHHHSTDPGEGEYDPVAPEPAWMRRLMAQHVAPRFCSWLKDKPSRPWFAALGFLETHIPYHRQPRPLPADELSRAVPWLPPHPALQVDIGNLNASLAMVDDALRGILAALANAGQVENTIVILTVDHGLALPRAKCSLYDFGLETGLLLRWPAKLAGNRVVSELLSNVDLMPTLLDLCGLPHQKAMDGRSFAGLLQGGEYRPRAAIFAEHSWHETNHYRPMRAIRTHRYKLIRYFAPRLPWNTAPGDFWSSCAAAAPLRATLDETPPEWELFDLAVDPHEQHNLLGTEGNAHAPAIHEALRARLDAWMHETGDPLLQGPIKHPVEG